MDDLISRQAAIDAILAVTGNSSVRELYEHVQEHGLSDMWSGGVNAAIDIIIAVPSAQPESEERTAESAQKIKQLPPVQPTLYGYDIKHLKLIAEILQKENLTPEKVVSALTDMERIVTIVMNEFVEGLLESMSQFKN